MYRYYKNIKTQFVCVIGGYGRGILHLCDSSSCIVICKNQLITMLLKIIYVLVNTTPVGADCCLVSDIWTGDRYLPVPADWERREILDTSMLHVL